MLTLVSAWFMGWICTQLPVSRKYNYETQSTRNISALFSTGDQLISSIIRRESWNYKSVCRQCDNRFPRPSIWCIDSRYLPSWSQCNSPCRLHRIQGKRPGRWWSQSQCRKLVESRTSQIGTDGNHCRQTVRTRRPIEL